MGAHGRVRPPYGPAPIGYDAPDVPDGRADGSRTALEAALGAIILPEDVIPVVRSVAPLSPHPIDADTPLLSSGIVDSFAVAELALALSVAFEVEMPLEALGVDNADTPAQLAALVNGLR